MKRVLKVVVVAILARQVRLLQEKHDFKIIGVVGGIGKTSTKSAIAQVLGRTLRVRYQEGNYNDIVTVPLIFFGHALPNLRNPFAWIKIFIDNMKQIRGEYPFDVVVVELGTDRVGQIAAFQKYVKLDYAVITAIVPEHMEYFNTMQTVASEELSVAEYTKKLIYNADLVAKEYRQPLKTALSYGNELSADYHLASIDSSTEGFEGDVVHKGKVFLHFNHNVVSEVQLYALLAAAVVGNELGLTATEILSGITTIRPVNGRLQRLSGINGSLIIDDTYNAIPESVRIALEMLYKMKASQKIAILGNMNQLGAMSEQEHKSIGELCDPAQLDLVITIGPDAKRYLAATASAKGCIVKSFNTPYEAGDYLCSKIRKGAIILAKGSQDKVFAEEAIKPLLADPKDASQLVRQSAYWLKRKQKSFT
ncbi:MAG TPA: Mur ligase family protein [Verrucomicrobiae bacterium]|nr:Mur ligase family protein [Verrucomicrobiae bacterium]